MVLGAVEVGSRDVLNIEDRAGAFYGVTDGLGAGWETLVDEGLVIVHQPLELTLRRGDGVEAFDVTEAQGFQVYRSTILGARGYIRSHLRRIDKKHTLSVL